MSLLLKFPVLVLAHTKSILLFHCAVFVDFIVPHSSTSFRVFEYRRCFCHQQVIETKF